MYYNQSMATTKELPLSNRRAMQRVADFAARAPAAARLPPHALVRALRAELHMTQTQLAKRAGITQSHLARIEAGKVDPQVSTLRKIFSALFCDVLVVPCMLKKPQDVMLERVKERARRNVLRVTGTMALEKQAPDGETILNLIRSEEARLLAHPSSEMWAD
jgi:transcriptional regulator with XRE-family HTH domain